LSRSADDAVVGAYAAYTKGRRNEQSALAQEALKLDPASHPAAVLHFLAHWQGGNANYAAKFIHDFSRAHGVTANSLYCLILGSMQAGASVAEIQSNTAAWLNHLPPDDIRAVLHRRGGRELQVLATASLQQRSASVGPSIVDRYGPVSAVKSCAMKDMAVRWQQPSFHVVKDIRVMPDAWFLYDDTAVYMNETLSWPQKLKEPRLFMAPMSAMILAVTERQALLNLPTRTVTIDQPCILVGSDMNFYRFLTDNVGRLKSLEGNWDFRSMPLLVDENLSEIHRDCFRRLGIDDAQLIRCSPHDSVLCRELIVPTLLTSIEVTHPAAIGWLRDSLGSPQRDPTLPRRILVSRSKPHRRKFLNEAEVFSHLKPLGFEIVTPDALPFIDQVRAYQNADIVIGPFGTCLTGLVFAPSSCATLELIDEQSIPVHRYIENIAIHLGQRFECFLTRKHKSQWSATTAEHEFEVDPQAMIAAVSRYI